MNQPACFPIYLAIEFDPQLYPDLLPHSVLGNAFPMYITIKGQLSWNLFQPTQFDCRQAALVHAHHLLATRRTRKCLLAAMVCNLVSELLEILFNLTFLVLKNPFQSTNTKVPTLRFCIFPKISSKLLKYDFSFNCTCRKFYIWWLKVSTFLFFHYLCLTSLFIVWMLLLGPSICWDGHKFQCGLQIS